MHCYLIPAPEHYEVITVIANTQIGRGAIFAQGHTGKGKAGVLPEAVKEHGIRKEEGTREGRERGRAQH